MEALKGKLPEDKLPEVAEIIKETGALDYAMNLARTYAKNAVAIIDDIESSGLVVDGEYARVLKELALFSVEREK
ncbi:hypothetical protein D1872_249130 [compost metagenome]